MEYDFYKDELVEIISTDADDESYGIKTGDTFRLTGVVVKTKAGDFFQCVPVDTAYAGGSHFFYAAQVGHHIEN